MEIKGELRRSKRLKAKQRRRKTSSFSMGNKGELRRSKRLKTKQDEEIGWQNLPYDLLLRILSMVSLMDRVLNVAAVCRSWRAAIPDPFLSPETLDISEFRHQLNPKLRVARRRDLLRIAFERSIDVALGSLKNLAFDSSFQLKNSHLLYASSRCPNLRELELPSITGNITQEGLTEAFNRWTQLECLVLGDGYCGFNLIEIAGHNCPELKVLNFHCPSFFLSTAADIDSIVSSLPRLKVLKIRCNHLYLFVEDAVRKLRLGLPELEEISITADSKVIGLHSYQLRWKKSP